MRITRKIADLIVKKTKELTELNMNVMDKHGIIISSSDPERIGMLHEGAAEVVRRGEEMTITEEQAGRWAGSKPGINMPIYFHTEVVGVIGITGHEREVVPFGRAVRMMTELLLQQSYLSEQVEMKERSKMYLVQELIMNAKADQTMKDSLYTRGELLGVNLRLPRVILLVQMNVLDDTKEYIVRFKEIAALFPSPKETLVAQIGRGRWMILADASVYKTNRHAKKALLDIAEKINTLVTEWFQAAVYVAVGRLCADIGDVGESFYETVKMLDISGKESRTGAVFHIEDSALQLVLSEITDGSAKQLISQVLGELVQHPNLLETVQAFYDYNMNVNTAANVIGIHRNTLLYRLDRVATFIGEDPRQFRQAMRIQLALMLYRIQETKE
ncbi:helix-turn-helix domain-containing protein [Paenibacillus sp. GSMTC-2017]|uniref:CdaR family transcriptional regulator n=1 Tax=Paenibacillus sp. GSMTC-2017 TaxID=2794350 RepID=UPI0018D75B06|nr:sugar diacid recognition domain-containing protein [Paenibacillus sp. GSMTC-2017]MBH5319744.1 helix-turn-helix domain-containing protein [Paenibacillus sp. GSMTC-2017]